MSKSLYLIVIVIMISMAMASLSKMIVIIVIIIESSVSVIVPFVVAIPTMVSVIKVLHGTSIDAANATEVGFYMPLGIDQLTPSIVPGSHATYPAQLPESAIRHRNRSYAFYTSVKIVIDRGTADLDDLPIPVPPDTPPIVVSVSGMQGIPVACICTLPVGASKAITAIIDI